MHFACTYRDGMAKNIQIRNVPEAVHRRLTRRAAQAGMSLSEFLLAERSHYASLPTPEEMRERLRSRKAVKLTESAAAAVRKERDSA
jgi:hypothetical protein